VEFFFNPTRLGMWMVAAALLCAGLLFARYWYFRRERQWLPRLRAHLGQHRDNASEFWSTFSGPPPVVPIESLTFKRVDTVRYLEHSGVPVDAATLSEIGAANEESRRINAVPAYLLSVFLIIGLGGTFLALRELLNNSPLRNVAASGQIDSQQLQLAIGQIYQGFGGAFYASITGIAATVILLALRIMVVAPERDKFFADLDELTQVHLIPMFRPRNDERDLSGYARQIALNLVQMTERATELSNRLHEYTATAGATADKLHDQASRLSGVVTNLNEAFAPDSRFNAFVIDLDRLIQRAEKRHDKLINKIADAAMKTDEHLQEVQKLSTVASVKTDDLLAAHERSIQAARERDDRAQDELVRRSTQLESVAGTRLDSIAQQFDKLIPVLQTIGETLKVFANQPGPAATLGRSDPAHRQERSVVKPAVPAARQPEVRNSKDEDDRSHQDVVSDSEVPRQHGLTPQTEPAASRVRKMWRTAKTVLRLQR
jgi:hypothetical protein